MIFNMLWANLLEVLKDEKRSKLQEIMLMIHLRDIAFWVIRWICPASIILIVISYWFHFVEGSETLTYIKWQGIISTFLVWMSLAVTYSRTVHHWPNLFSGIIFGAVAFFTGNLLVPIEDPSGGLQALIYFIPLYTIMTPSRLTKRILITGCCFLAVFGGFLTGHWSIGILTTVTFLVVCMSTLSIIIGHTCFYRLNRQNFFNQRQLQLQQQKIERLAKYDQLTGLYERHIFEDRLREEFKNAIEQGNELSLLMIDIDHFKKINDTYGHTAGDTVLDKFGDLISSINSTNLSSSGIPCRFGGEEFCVLLPETDADGAEFLAKKIRKTLSKRTFQGQDDEEFAVTCSIGVSELENSMTNHERLIQYADNNLYKAKETGRNQVIGKSS